MKDMKMLHHHLTKALEHVKGMMEPDEMADEMPEEAPADEESEPTPKKGKGLNVMIALLGKKKKGK